MTFSSSSPIERFADSLLDLLPGRQPGWSLPVRLLRFVAGGAIVTLGFIAMVVYGLAGSVQRQIETLTFRKFDRYATAAGKYVLIFVTSYLAFMIYAAWCNGSFDRLVR